jgi:hypothetical protein
MPLLVITAPWVGHATWAAYKAMVGEDELDEEPSLEHQA